MQKFYNVKSPLCIDLSVGSTIYITLDESSDNDILLEFVNEQLSTDYILVVIVPGRSKIVTFPANLDDDTVNNRIELNEGSINVIFFSVEMNYHIDRIIRATL